MKIILCLLVVFLGANAIPVGSEIPAVEPEYLKRLLDEGNYEEFSMLLGIPDPQLVMESNTDERTEISRHEAMFHKSLKGGDMLPELELPEMGRQAINFTRYRGSRWPNGRMPYVINDDSRRNNFTSGQTKRIEDGIARWNEQLGDCLKLVPRSDEPDYIMVISADGCWSYVGRTGRQQALSLAHRGCLSQGTVLHEFQHAAGFTHEQNRLDRDDFIEILWDNIPDDWKDQYKKADSRTYHNVGRYDYYSIMHYPIKAPGTDDDAFRVLDNRVRRNAIGNGNDFTSSDVAKIKRHYGC